MPSLSISNPVQRFIDPPRGCRPESIPPGPLRVPPAPAALPLLLLVVAGTWAPPGAAAAPLQAAASDTVPLATLAGWSEELWLDLLDREGTFHGFLADEGIFQRFHLRMDAEYALDMRTGFFTSAEEAAWARAREGIRAAGKSISYPHIVHRADWKDAFPIAGAVELTADYRRDHSLTDRRDHPRLGVRWRDVGGSGWTAWSRLGLHFFKPAADIEVGATRSWPAGEEGLWRLDLRIAALDAFSDAVFVGLGVDPRDADAHVDQAGAPVAARALIERRGRRWRLEAHGGVTPRMRSHITFPRRGAQPFDLSERVWFAGALVEGLARPGLTVAGYGRTARAETRHVYAPELARSRHVSERTHAVGAHARQRLGDLLTLEAELHAAWKPETRADEDGVLEHDDREVFGTLALARRPPSGWTGRLAWAVLDRNAGVLLPVVHGRNHRLVTEAGYRTAAGFEVSAGIAFDLDDLADRALDGGHLRLSAFPFPARVP